MFSSLIMSAFQNLYIYMIIPLLLLATPYDVSKLWKGSVYCIYFLYNTPNTV